MTLLRNLLLIAFLISAFYACTEGDEKDSTIFKFGGTVEGTSDSTAFLHILDSNYILKLEEDSFSIDIPLSQPTIGRFSVSLQNLAVFAQPGENLIFNINEDTTFYEGSLAVFHRQVQSVREDHLKSAEFSNLRNLYSMPLDSFERLLFTSNEQVIEALDTIVQDDHEDWKWAVWNALSTPLANYGLNYPFYHGRLTQNDSFQVTASYFDRITDAFQLESTKIPLNEKRIGMLKTFVESYIRQDTPYIESDSARLQLMFSRTEELFKKDTLVELVHTQIIKEQLKYSGLGDAEPMITNYVNNLPESSSKSALKDKLNKWEKQKAGNIAPGFKAQYPDSTEVALEDFKGKVVYIDVWATWCGPCLREIPHLERMYERYADRDDLALISISIDSDYEKWHKKVNEDEMGGIQLWVEDAWDSDLNESYMISSIPRFILIDKEGRIVDADAPRPSSEEIIYDMIEAEL